MHTTTRVISSKHAPDSVTHFLVFSRAAVAWSRGARFAVYCLLPCREISTETKGKYLNTFTAFQRNFLSDETKNKWGAGLVFLCIFLFLNFMFLVICYFIFIKLLDHENWKAKQSKTNTGSLPRKTEEELHPWALHILACTPPALSHPACPLTL